MKTYLLLLAHISSSIHKYIINTYNYKYQLIPASIYDNIILFDVPNIILNNMHLVDINKHYIYSRETETMLKLLRRDLQIVMSINKPLIRAIQIYAILGVDIMWIFYDLTGDIHNIPYLSYCITYCNNIRIHTITKILLSQNNVY